MYAHLLSIDRSRAVISADLRWLIRPAFTCARPGRGKSNKFMAHRFHVAISPEQARPDHKSTACDGQLRLWSKACMPWLDVGLECYCVRTLRVWLFQQAGRDIHLPIRVLC